MKLILILSLAVGARADGCRSGIGKCNDPCTTSQTVCEEDWSATWDLDCPDPSPGECSPLAPSDDDPSCTGPPKAIDRFGKKMYSRKLIAREKPLDDEVKGVFCHVTFELCPGETMITQGIDSGHGDYYRLSNVPNDEWCDFEGPITVDGNADYRFGGMSACGEARSYSPVTPLNEESVQLIIKQARSDAEKYGCEHGKDCLFGMSELACMAPIGTEFLLSAVPDHSGTTDSTHYAYRPNFSMKPGEGPYTINVIGQGVALTELNIGVISDLLNPINSDGSFSTIKTVNYLWANSYWADASWVFENPTDSTDLARKMAREGLKYGIQFNLMHAISREERPEAEFWRRIDVDMIGEAFDIPDKSTDKDPYVKWFVVGSKGFKQNIYPQILEWGYAMYPCSPAADKKGYPYCGPNSLYEWEVPGADGLTNRERSPLFEYYEGLPPVPPPTPPCKSCTTNLDCDEGEICEGGSGRRKLRFGNIHDGCCRIADEL